MRVYQLDPKTGIKRYALMEHGFYTLGDYKRFGNEQHQEPNPVRVRSEQEMIDLILRGHYVRVENGSKRPSLVRRHLYVDGRQVT